MSFKEVDFKRQLVLLNEIENQTDRGTAIVGVAWVEEELKSAIRSRCIDDKKAWKNLFSSSGPLGSFSSNIELAYLLSIISKSQYLDLHLIRKIRNDFAHKLISKEIETLDFTTPYIMDRCMSINCTKNENLTTARKAFCRACGILYADLYLVSFMGKNNG